MASFNKVMMMGNLTRDPELRTLPSGTSVCDIGMATNRRYKTQDGQDREETCFVDLVVFGRQAEVLHQYKKKGDPLFIEGRLKLDTWDAPDGTKVPVILFTKGGGPWLEAMAATGCDALGLDWTINIDEARERVGDKVALQGNLDPAMLYAKPEIIRDNVADVLKRFGNHPGHVFNLGHGVTPQVNPDHVAALVDAVHELSAR